MLGGTETHVCEQLAGAAARRTIILVFRHQGSLRKSDGFTPNRGAEYQGVSDCTWRRNSRESNWRPLDH